MVAQRAAGANKAATQPTAKSLPASSSAAEIVAAAKGGKEAQRKMLDALKAKEKLIAQERDVFAIVCELQRDPRKIQGCKEIVMSGALLENHGARGTWHRTCVYLHKIAEKDLQKFLPEAFPHIFSSGQPMSSPRMCGRKYLHRAFYYLTVTNPDDLIWHHDKGKFLSILLARLERLKEIVDIHAAHFAKHYGDDAFDFEGHGCYSLLSSGIRCNLNGVVIDTPGHFRAQGGLAIEDNYAYKTATLVTSSTPRLAQNVLELFVASSSDFLSRLPAPEPIQERPIVTPKKEQVNDDGDGPTPGTSSTPSTASTGETPPPPARHIKVAPADLETKFARLKKKK